MPNWKKVIVSGSNAILNSLTSSNGVVITGSLVTTGSNTLIGNTSLTGSLNISGSTTQVGSNNLLGNTTLSGSIIISGSTTVPTVQVYGNVTHDGYIRFNPVSTNLDTTISASYIYVSGSTQDLYFSQNSKGYSNVTRLRWIEGNLYTGLLHGGVITSQSSTVYQISSGSGIIVDLNASLSDDPYPTIQYLEWPNLSASIDAFTASYQQCFVGIDSTNNIFAQETPFTNGQFDTIINIGNVLFQNQTSINGFKTQPSTAYGFEQAQNIFNRAFGPLKLSGYTLSPSGSSTGSLVVGSGTAYAPGANYTVNPNEPYYVIDPGTNVSKIFRYYQSGSTWVYDTNAGAGYGAIDPTRYSNNGVLTAVPAPANQNWTIQRVFYFPNSVTKAIVVYYGNTYYGSESEALANIAFESFIEAPNTAANAIYLGAIVISGTGVFTNAATFTIYPSGLFRQVGGSGGGGSTVTTTLAGLSDVNISAPTDGQALVYNNTALKWENKSFISASISGNAATATTASFANTASYVLNAVSSSFASTASYLNTLNQDLTFNGNLTLNGTASISFLNVTYESASIIYSSGSNQLGDATNDTQTLIGRTIVSGSFEVTGSTNIPNITGSLLGTASYATQALSSSFATTASYVLNAISSSFASTASYVNLLVQDVVITGSLTVITGSNIELQVLNTGVRLGNVVGDIHTITGSLGITGSTTIDGNTIVTGSLTVVTGSNIELQVTNTGVKLGNVVGDIHNVTGSLRASGSSHQLSGSVILTTNVGSLLTLRASTSSSALFSLIIQDNAGRNLLRVRNNGALEHGSGSGFTATGLYAHAEGFSTVASGIYSHAEGFSTVASGIYSHAEGYLTTTIGDYSHTEGEGTIASGSAQTAMGKYNTQNNSTSLVIIGNGTSDVSRSDLALFNTNGIQFTQPVTASIISGSFTGSLFGTASYATQALSASFATTSSYILNAVSASFASTASSVNPLNQNVIITGSLTVITGSNIELQVLNTGVRLGNIIGDVHTVTGSLGVSGSSNFNGDTAITGSLIITGSTGDILAVNITGSRKVLRVGPTPGTYTGTILDVNDGYVTISGQKANGLALDIVPGGLFGIRTYGGTNQYSFLANRSDAATQVFRLGGDGTVTIGNVANSSTHTLQVRGFGATSATNAIYVTNTSNTALFTVRDDGNVGIGTSSPNSILDVSGSTIITGSLNVTAGITGSLLGTATTASYVLNAVSSSFATTASYVLNAVSASFASTASSVNTLNQNVTINGNLNTTGSISGSYLRLSSSFNTASSGSILTVIGSGSAQPIFTVQGSQGELFSITDSLSGSLFSVNDISGLPILEVFSDNTTLIGDYQSPALITTKKVAQTNSGSFVVYSIPTASYDGAFIEYTLKSGSNARAGTIMSTWANSTIQFTEVDTMDIGSTTAVGLTMILSGSNAVLTGSSSTGTWTIKTIVRAI